MSNGSQYLGSQAFNQSFAADEYVIPNTGSLILSKTLVSLRGLAAGVNLNITLSYSAGTAGLLGLPASWSFGIAHVVPGATLTAQGKTSVIDPTWADVTGYQSGLRYVNNHAIKFQTITPPQPLPSGQPGTYGFTLTYDDGACDFYDATGKLVEHDDLFGNHLNYFYTGQISGVFGNRLDHIVDSFGQTVSFGYGPGSIVITTPDGSRTTINFSAQGVQNVRDPLGNLTIFSYADVAGQTVVTTIEYPTGLKTRLDYTTLAYRPAGGGQAEFPAVSDHFHLDANGNILEHTGYAFGTDSGGNTFTGFSAGFALSRSADSLMDSNNTAYLYDVLVTRLDAAGTLQAASRVYYNYLHLPVREEHYLVDSSSTVGKGYRALYSYQVDPDFHARATSYAQPVGAQQLIFSVSAGDYVPLRQATATYDEFGRILSSEEAMYDPTTRTWARQTVTTNTYVVTKWGGEMPRSEIYVDGISGFQRQVAYTLTADQKSIATAAVLFRADAQSAWSPWKTKSYAYDASGRVTTIALAWSSGRQAPPPGATATITTNAYTYNAGTRAYGMTSTDALGNTTTWIYDVGVATGPMTQTTTPLGASTTYEYDALGRAILTIDAEGHSTATVYNLSNGSNSAVTTGPTGYVLVSFFDAMGREIRTLDNGDPRKTTGPTPNRTLHQTAYDERGNIARVTDELGLTTRYLYDSLNRSVRSTDPLGNVSTTTYNDGAGTASYAVNDTLRRTIQFDGLGRTVRITDFADPNDASITYALLRQISYNGFGLATGEQLSSAPLNGGSPQTLQQGTFTYDVEASVLSELYVGSNGPRVTTSRTTTYDLFGNPVVYRKQTTYADGRSFKTSGSTTAFDAAGRLTSITNQLRQVERYTYDADGHLKTLTRYDGTVFTYSHGRTGELLRMAWPGHSIAYTYLPNGLVQTTASGDAVMRYSYSLDGTLQSVTYPDGRTQAYGLDAMSRVVSQTDPSGAVTATTFNPFGQIALRRHGGDSVAYAYGTVNHVAGVLTGDSLSGAAPSVRQLSYDGFGRTSATVATGQAALRAGYTRDAVGRLTALALSSTTSNDPRVNLTHRFSYDGINQLTGNASTYNGGQPPSTEAYRYDGNFNVVNKTDNGTTQAFTYNAIDQLAMTGVTYDANGRLTADGSAGHNYTYNALDQLIQVAANDGTPLIAYSYHPDNTLATTRVGRNVLTFYYNNGEANAIAAASAAGGSPAWTAFLFDAGGRHAAYTTGQPPSYFLLGTDSTSLLQQSGRTAVAFDYDAYGAITDGAPLSGNETFGWNQEYADPVSGLVYLRARYYNPSLMRFMTMDNLNKDNRYAFGAGDPINHVDPTGHMETSEIVGLLVGTFVAVVAGAVSFGAGASVGALIIGSQTVGVSVGATVLAGVGASVAGDAVSAGITGQKITAGRLGIDALSGAVGGAAAGAVGGIAGRVAMAMVRSPSPAAISTIRAVSAAGGGIAGSAAAAGVTTAFSGQPFFSSNTALSLAAGALTGAFGGFRISGAFRGIRNAKIKPVKPTESELRGFNQSGSVNRELNGDESVFFSEKIKGNREGPSAGNPKVVNARLGNPDNNSQLDVPEAGSRFTSQHQIIVSNHPQQTGLFQQIGNFIANINFIRRQAVPAPENR